MFVDGFGPLGILDRISDITEMPVSIKPGQKLQIIVENMGRICFGPNISDFKGIISNVTLNGVTLSDWDMNCMPLNKRKHLPLQEYFHNHLTKSILKTKGSMSFWNGYFKGCVDGKPRDTFLDMSGWKKVCSVFSKSPKDSLKKRRIIKLLGIGSN